MSNKTLFQRDEPLRNFWLAVSKQDDFQRVLAYAMGELADEALTTGELAGMKRLKDKLLAMADIADEKPYENVSSGIEHDVLGAYQRSKEKDKPK